jgi:DNA-directed RNA polymerase alpha subunit
MRPIEALHLNTRTENALIRAGIDTIEKLSSMTMEELMKVKGVGFTGTREATRKLSAYLSPKII